jgi:hypothetical protein
MIPNINIRIKTERPVGNLVIKGESSRKTYNIFDSLNIFQAAKNTRITV